MKHLLFITLTFLAFNYYSQVNQNFPRIKGSSLEGKSVTIPQNNGKYSVVAIAYSKNAEDDLKGWLNPMFDSFIKTKSEPGAFDVADFYDVNFMFIPMINGFKKVASDFKKGTDKEYWPYIMDTESGDIKEVQAALGVTNTNLPYFYVLNKDGKIVEVQSGRFSEEKMNKIESAIE